MIFSNQGKILRLSLNYVTYVHIAVTKSASRELRESNK